MTIKMDKEGIYYVTIQISVVPVKEKIDVMQLAIQANRITGNESESEDEQKGEQIYEAVKHFHDIHKKNENHESIIV